MHIKRDNMEDVRRSRTGRRGRANSESRMISERRPLFTVALSPPNYEVPAQNLIDSFIEKEVKFAGIVSGVSKYVDATNRTDVLREIDRGKREKCVVWKTTFEDDAIFSISVHNIKISQRDGEEEVLLRLAVHEIEAMSYIKDDDQHILCIKFIIEENNDERDSELSDSSSQLAVLYCDSLRSAEELCSLLTHCFQLVYTSNTMRYLDDKVNEAAAGLSISSSTIRSESLSNNRPPAHPDSGQDSRPLGFLSQSTTDLVNNTSTLSSATSRSLPRRNSNATQNTGENHDNGGLSAANEQLLQDYTRRLYTKLNINELRHFAMLVKAWHTNMPFKEFCDQVLELYGPERKHLITGMLPFIPEKDLSYFEMFVEKLGLHVSVAATGSGTLSSSSRVTSNRTSYGSSSSYSVHAGSATGTGSGEPDDYDKMLSSFSSNIDNLATSVSTESQYLSGNT